MSETFHTHDPAHEQKAYSQTSSPVLDTLIDQQLRRAMRFDLDKSALEEIQKTSDRGDRVDVACSYLVGRGQEDSFERAVTLRSLYAMRSIDVASRRLLPDESWDYNIPYSVRAQDKPFWPEVDDKLRYMLRFFTDESFQPDDIQERVSEINPDTRIASGAIARLSGRLIMRKTFRSVDQTLPHHVIYEIPAVRVDRQQ